MKTIRWGIIGCGAVTEVKSGPAYQQAAGFTLQAVMRGPSVLDQVIASSRPSGWHDAHDMPSALTRPSPVLW